MKHWAEKYIGIPWKLGEEDIEFGFDCWSLARYIQREEYNIEVPIIDIGEVFDIRKATSEFAYSEEFNNWIEIKQPEDGCMVLMSSSKYPSHIGVWLEVGYQKGVIHCSESGGVTFNNVAALKKNNWNILRYYKHRSKL